MKLPVTFESTVTSSNRVTIPTWLSFIDPGDLLEGYVQLINKDDSYPFSKKVSNSRHITVGHIKPFLQSRELPSRLRITIEKVHKQIADGLDFNLVGYKEENGGYAMNFSSIKPETSTQFHLDTFTENFVKKYFEDETQAVKTLLNPFFLDEVKKWIKPVFLPLYDEMGAKVPVILFLVLSQDYYQKLIDNLSKIDTLLQRLINWIYDINDFNIATLSKLSSQIQLILEKQKEPEYLDMKSILSLPSLQREIVLITLKEHRHGGITLDSIVSQVRNTKQNVVKEIDALVKRGILRQFDDEQTIVVDSLWVV
ncbi:MAG: hypothetical protein GOP50_03150 [Candidatus Heimdallarchaeota archaeon]|nr:hypothetical protein [Candidatus Heimdallarchaeota archaeon]